MKAKATAALLACPLPAAAEAQTAQAEASQAQAAQPWPMHGASSWSLPFHGLLWLLAVATLAAAAGLVVVVLMMIRYLWHGPGHHEPAPSRSTALQHLDERYARGEIDRDEYLQRRRDIAGD